MKVNRTAALKEQTERSGGFAKCFIARGDAQQAARCATDAAHFAHAYRRSKAAQDAAFARAELYNYWRAQREARRAEYAAPVPVLCRCPKLHFGACKVQQ